MIWVILLLLIGCTEPNTQLTVSATSTGLELHDDNGVPPLFVRNVAGGVVFNAANRRSLTNMWIPIDWSRNERVFVHLDVDLSDHPKEVQRPTTMETVQISIPLGQDGQLPPKGGVLQYVGMTDAAVSVGVSLVAMEPGSVEIKMGDKIHRFVDLHVGQRVNVMGSATAGQAVEIGLANESWRGVLQRQDMSMEEAQSNLRIEAIQFPVDSFGNPDVARPSGKITLPAEWWIRAMNKMGLGVRARDRTVPWGHVSVQIQNSSPVPVTLVARARVTGNNRPDPIFRPTMRDVDDGTGWVSVGFRAQPGASTIALPLYVDEGSLSEENRGRIERSLDVELSPAGSRDTVAERSVPLFVTRGSTPAAIGFALGALGALGGLVLILVRLRSWLSLDTQTLVTIALFATLSFVVNAAVQVVGFGFAGILGPFAFLVTGLLDDTVRACLLATLLFLRPYPGVCALSVLVGWMLRSVVLGAASPTDLLYLTGHVFFLEASLWIFGLTRGKMLSFSRLGLSFVATYSLTILAALAFNVVLYRLYYADWYIGLSIFANGFLFPLLACGIAIPFANTLKRVED